MLKNESIAIRTDQILTTESDVRFLIFESIMDNKRAKFSEVFYDSGKVIYKRRELEYTKQLQISSNLSMGICEGKKYFAHDQRIDRDCYFGYIMDIPKVASSIMCRTVVYDRSNVRLQTRTIKNIETVEVVQDTSDTYLIVSDEKTYIVKYLRAKNVVLAISDYGVIPTVGKRCSISTLEFLEKIPIEMYKLTSKLLKVEEANEVYICETEKTIYIILKDRKNDIFGICRNLPCIDQKMLCSSIEFKGIKPYLTKFVTGIVTSITKFGHILIVQTNTNTYYMEAGLVA